MGILKAMLKEEWRIHALMFGNRNFSFFPILIAVLAFIASALVPLYGLLLSRGQMAAVIHFVYLLFGLSVGGFGLMGREALNRRLGDISLIAYSSRTLPVSERRIFANFVVKDTIFYIMFLIAPFLAGYLPSRMIFGGYPTMLPYLAVSLTAAFLLGLSVSFLVSTAYANFGKPFLLLFGLVVFVYTLIHPGWLTFDGVSSLMPPLQYYLSHESGYLIASLLLIFALPIISLSYMRFDYHFTVERYNNQFNGLDAAIPFGEYSPFLAKDLLDINRSEGGIWKVFGSYMFPLAAVSLMISFFARFLPLEDYHILLLMSLMTGVVSTSLYNWLAEYDFPQLYEFLPISTSYILKSKLIIYGCFTAVASTAVIFLAQVYLHTPIIYMLLGLLLPVRSQPIRRRS